MTTRDETAENDAPDFKPPVDLRDLAIPDLTEQERDDFMAALAAEKDAGCRELTCPHHGEENRRGLECDHPGIEHAPGFATFNVGRCPGCGKCKFIGHGPLCWDCYTRPIPPAKDQP